MSIDISQSDYRVAKQRIRNLSIKINLLNHLFQTVDSLEGMATGGSVSIDADADIRRTCSLSMVVKDSTFKIEPGGQIWMDKYVQILVGIDSIVEGETIWQNLGTYIISNPSRVYNATENTLNFEALDLMAKVTGLRNGNLEGMPHIIPQGESIRDALIQVVVQLAGFSRFAIEDNPQEVPYEIRVDAGGTVFDLVAALRDISPNYEVFFDIDGVFRYQKIPSGLDDPVMVDNDLFDAVVTSVNTDMNFDDVKNVVEVLGRSHDPQVFVEVTTTSGNTYEGTAAGISSQPTENTVIGFVAKHSSTGALLKINSLSALPILNQDGTPVNITGGETAYYCVQAVSGTTHYLYLGKVQISATAKETNPNSPFYVGGSIGEIRIVLNGGEYENIWTDDLALQRAEYELYLRARLLDSIQLSMVPVYWMDVNVKVEYINEKVGLTNKGWNPSTFTYDLPSHFLTKKIDFGLGYGDSMQLSATRFYPLYPTL